jgi:glucose-1-phosphate adenylyltransferase
MNDPLPAKTLAFVLGGDEGRRLSPLTRYRPKPLVPFGGCFRILDFVLSNCFNSELDCAYVLTQHDSEAVAVYLRRGWCRLRGIQEFASAKPPVRAGRYAGTADAVLQNLHLMLTHGRTLALVLSADYVYKMDYRNLLRFHAASGADVTIASADETSAVDGKANIGAYVFNYEALLAAVEDGGHFPDIASDLIPHLVRSHNVALYWFEGTGKKKAHYCRDIGTLQAYYDASMDLLESDRQMDPYDSNWPIRSSGGARQSGRIALSDVGDETGVNSVIPLAADISGASVYRSVLSPGVVLESGADVRDSVLLPGAIVRRGAMVRRAIIDAHVIIEAGDQIGYSPVQDRSRFHVLPSGVVVVSPDHVSVCAPSGATYSYYEKPS